MSSTNTNVDLRPMSEKDLEFVNKIRNHDSTRKFLRNTNLISLDDTKTWYKTTHPKWFIIYCDGNDVGYVRTSHDTSETICIGCDIDVDKRGNGYARAAYQKVISDLYDKDYIVIWLELFKNNNVAMNLYSSLGFTEINSSFKDERQRVTMVHIRQYHV